MKLATASLFLALILVCASSALAGPSLWVESAGDMILPDRPAGTAQQIERSGCRNEFVVAALALRTDAAPTVPYAFDWTALKGPDDKEIGKENITLFRGAEVVVDHGDKVSEDKDKARARVLGSYPDALVPLVAGDGTNVANAITPEANKTVPFWVDIFIPAGTPPGEYAGKVVLKMATAEVACVPVKVKVINLEIPADSSIPSLFNLRVHPHVVANIDAYVAEIMRHRIQPTNYHYVDYVHDKRFGWPFLDKFNPDAKGFVNVYFGVTEKLSDAEAAKQIDLLKEVTAHLKERKLFDRSFLHLKDEPDASAIAGMAEFAKLVIKEVPEWKGKLADTLNKEGTELDSLLTHHIRALKCYGSWYGQPPRTWGGRAEWDQRRQAGQQFWFYVSNAQGVPFPTWDIQTVNLAWEPRMLGWAFWYEKAYGHLFWDLLFEPKWQLNKKFPPGDGQLIFPGDFTLPGAPAWVLVKDLKGPVATRRLKHQRQGLQEWELLRMAERKVGREKVQAIVDQVYICLGKRSWAPDAYDPKQPMWSYDEAQWDQARQAVINLLLP